MTKSITKRLCSFMKSIMSSEWGASILWEASEEIIFKPQPSALNLVAEASKQYPKEMQLGLQSSFWPHTNFADPAVRLSESVPHFPSAALCRMETSPGLRLYRQCRQGSSSRLLPISFRPICCPHSTVTSKPCRGQLAAIGLHLC